MGNNPKFGFAVVPGVLCGLVVAFDDLIEQCRRNHLYLLSFNIIHHIHFNLRATRMVHHLQGGTNQNPFNFCATSMVHHAFGGTNQDPLGEWATSIIHLMLGPRSQVCLTLLDLRVMWGLKFL